MRDLVNRPSITVTGAGIGALMIAISVAVIALGIFREWYVAAFGTHTAAQDLHQIALDRTHSLGAWWSSIMLAGGCSLLLLIAVAQRAFDRTMASRWLSLAAVFFVLSIDQGVNMHDAAQDPQTAFQIGSIWASDWFLPASLACIAVVWYFLPFVAGLNASHGWAFLAAGAIYAVGAFGMETVSFYLANRFGIGSAVYSASGAIGESLKIAAVTIFVTVLLAIIRQDRRHYVLRLA